MLYLQVSATDPDCGVNAIVNYTMGDGLSKYREFEVNPSTGEICIGAPLDHEKRSIYEFPILATDRGKRKESVDLILVIHLQFYVVLNYHRNGLTTHKKSITVNHGMKNLKHLKNCPKFL